jgi:hypothetical protein
MLTRNLVTSQKETINVRVMGFGEWSIILTLETYA